MTTSIGTVSLLNKESNTFIEGNVNLETRAIPTVIKSDAFDRLRVSEPNTLFESTSIFNKNITITEFISGSGSSILHPTDSYIEMTVADSGVGKVVRQSYEYIPYQPGKSRLMIFTGVLELSGGVGGAICRIGCFDSSVEKTAVAGPGNGLFFELNGTTMYVVERLNNVDTKVEQSSWNLDTLDGTGPSGITISTWNNAFIFTISQEWLGVGIVRFGLMVNGAIIPVHIFNHSGIGTPTSTAIQKPYTRMAKLPVRYEIQSTSAINAEMRMICSTVISEGGFVPVGNLFAQGSTTAKTASATVFTPIISLKLQAVEPQNRLTLLLRSLQLINTTSNRFVHYRLYKIYDQASLTGPSWADVDLIDSGAQIDFSATAVSTTNTKVIVSGYQDVKSTSTFNFDNYLNSPLVNSDITGNSTILCLTCKGIGGTASVYGSFDWLEIQ